MAGDVRVPREHGLGSGKSAFPELPKGMLLFTRQKESCRQVQSSHMNS